MGRFIGKAKDRGNASAKMESPDRDTNTGLVLVSNGSEMVLSGGAQLDRDPLPDYINANQSINTTFAVTGAFANSTYTYAWRNGAQYGLSLSSSGTLTGAASSMIALSTLNIDVTDTAYGNQKYEFDIDINVSPSNSFPDITTNTTSQETLLDPTVTLQFANSGTATEWSITTAGNLPAGTTINNSGLMTFPASKAGDGSNTTYTFTLGVRNNDLPAGVYRTTAFSKPVNFQTIQGQQQYEGAYGQNGGQCTYTWTAPAGVTKVHVMALGAGGGGCYQWAVCGGHGGGMVWANCIPVSPGSNYTINVGRGGCWSGTIGGNRCWPGMPGCGGCCGCYGGCFTHGGTGATGTCGSGFGHPAYPSTAGGGGGAAGYCCGHTHSYSGCGCGGGAGSAGSHHSSTYGTGAGGGTGACGMCCYRDSPHSYGCCSNAGYSHQTGGGGNGGSGGTCGRPGEPWSNGQGNGHICGGCFGGAGGGSGTSHGGGWGGPGVVRIIWGNNRCWPCCQTHNL